VLTLIADDMREVDAVIARRLDSGVPLVGEVSRYIISSGGKRLRPALLLLVCGALGFRGEQRFNLAAVVEFIHTATLLHDDVVDDADLRRGRRTASKVWGNQISILVGDYLYSRAICQIVDFRNQGINEALSEACRKMAEGEVLQLYYNGNPLMPEPEYLRIIEHKTAGLIAASCKIGAIIGGATEELQEVLFRFGQRLGIAFQLADDTLDYTANGEHLGKTLGQDLRQGKATLPLLHLLQHCSEPDRQLIKDRMETRTLTDEELRRIVALMQEYGSIAYSMERARAFVAAAKRDLDLFHDNTAKRALSIAADYMVTRDR